MCDVFRAVLDLRTKQGCRFCFVPFIPRKSKQVFVSNRSFLVLQQENFFCAKNMKNGVSTFFDYEL